MGNLTEFGLLLVLVFVFSAPLLQNLLGKRIGQEDDDE